MVHWQQTNQESLPMPTLKILVGPAGSGKTTYIRNNSLNAVSRDDIRKMLNAPFGADEDAVTRVEDMSLRSHLKRGEDVAVDATNLRPKFIKGKVAIARELGAEVEFEIFDVDLETLFERNKTRLEEDRIPEHAVFRQYNTFRSNMKQGFYELEHYKDAKTFDEFNIDETKPRAVVVDIDGTVAMMNGRSPYDYDKVTTDVPNKPVIDVVRGLSKDGHTIVFLSGREDSCFEDTHAWLNTHVGVAFAGLHMRPAGDQRRDSVVKHGLFADHVAPHYNVRLVIDDRKQVVDMWRAAGLTCMQVAEGNF